VKISQQILFIVKLAWLLGNYPKEKINGLIVKNLRGEINERILIDEFLDVY